MKKTEKHIPMIGLRIIKSGIAVALCFVIAYFRGNEGIVFYSLLSALWCIQMYRKVYVVSSSTSQKVLQLIRESGLSCFVNIIMDDMLVIYYSESENPAYNNVVKMLRRSPFRNYVKREPPQEEEVVYFMILEQKDKVEQFFRALTEQGWERELKIIKYDSDQYPGYEYMKIYNKNATPFSA